MLHLVGNISQRTEFAFLYVKRFLKYILEENLYTCLDWQHDCFIFCETLYA